VAPFGLAFFVLFLLSVAEGCMCLLSLPIAVLRSALSSLSLSLVVVLRARHHNALRVLWHSLQGWRHEGRMHTRRGRTTDGHRGSNDVSAGLGTGLVLDDGLLTDFATGDERERVEGFSSDVELTVTLTALARIAQTIT
jgi:hypothetical protein